MGALINSMDWSQTPLGPLEDWPQSLRTAVGILLNSRYPMFVFWGPQLVKIYNDAYRPITGAKHPWALGRPAPEVWPEIWDTIGPMVERVVERGEATWSDDLLLFMERSERSGFPEEVYFTFSYSPVYDESGGVGGLFCACTETTDKVLGERRLRSLRDLAAVPSEARSIADACLLSAKVLEASASDVPFSLLYLLEEDGSARLAASSGIEAGAAIAPAVLRPDDEGGWPFARVIEHCRSELVTPLPSRFSSVPPGPWPEPPEAALLSPLGGSAGESPAGLLVLGVSARRPLDDRYRDYLSLVTQQIAGSIASARATEQERRRAEALAELDRAKTTFFSNVSHEFRTPLALMLGHLEELLEGRPVPLPAELEGEVEVAHRNALRLLKLVNTLLDFSRIEEGRIEAVYEPTDLAAATRELASAFRSAVERAGLRLVVDCEPLAAPVHVDREMWEKIVLNLVSNAFKFTFEGEIEVALRAAGDRVELTVRDTGTGIPGEEIPRLFERFHRVQGARSRSHEGSGIGLALVKELVELHGGGIEVDSEIDRGTRFVVAIPTGTAHLPADRVGAKRTLASTSAGAAPYIEEMLRWYPDVAESVVGPEAAEPSDSEEEPARILVADDNADLRDYLVRLLSPSYSVKAVANGAAALAAARSERFDLVLSDVMMPELDGFELLRELRNDPDTHEIPVVLLSARAGEDSRVEGLDRGADDYLVKPFSARELAARVRSQLALAKMRRRAEEERRARLEELERTVHLSDLFVGVLGHDLRTPLNSITLGASLLRAQLEGAGDPVRAELLRPIDRIAGSARRMARMIQQILDFTRARVGGGIPIERRELDLAELCRHAVAEPGVPDLHLELVGDLAGRWDGDRLEQVASNLIGNALEHRAPGSPVQVRADGSDAGRVRFEVRNRGVIPAEVLPRLFEPFRRGDDRAQGSNLGLGLFITRAIARAHGGDVEVESSEEAGTRFVVELPR